jgi:hypothetical protein
MRLFDWTLSRSFHSTEWGLPSVRTVNPCGLKNRYRSSRTEGVSSLSFRCGESPRRPRSVLPTLEPFPLFRSERSHQGKRPLLSTAGSPQFASRSSWARKCGSGEGVRFLDSLSCVPGLFDWNRRAVSSSPSLRPPSGSYALRLSKGAKVTRRYERLSCSAVVVFMSHWATITHRQSYAVV